MRPGQQRPVPVPTHGALCCPPPPNLQLILSPPCLGMHGSRVAEYARTVDMISAPVKVICRFRPQLQVEVSKGGSNCAFINVDMVRIVVLVCSSLHGGSGRGGSGGGGVAGGVGNGRRRGVGYTLRPLSPLADLYQAHQRRQTRWLRDLQVRQGVWAECESRRGRCAC